MHKKIHPVTKLLAAAYDLMFNFMFMIMPIYVTTESSNSLEYW